ncbi:MAG: Mbeg1-like protein [Raoultibacter sp.]|jgi:hypothetical protein
MNSLTEFLTDYRFSFSERPFCVIDSLLFTQFSYLNCHKMVPRLEALGSLSYKGDSQLTQKPSFTHIFKSPEFGSIFDNYRIDKTLETIEGLATNPRYTDITISEYINLMEEGWSGPDFQPVQFAAYSLFLHNQFVYVVFRGTDDTMHGWYESCQMACNYPVPAQTYTLRYLETIAHAYPQLPLYVGGHSKGGNLAVYAALNASEATKNRIVEVHDFDGPGFQPGDVGEKEFASLTGRVKKFIPQNSLFGLLLEERDEYRVVSSWGNMIEQHDPYFWAIENGNFVYFDTVDSRALRRQKVISEWFASLSREELSVSIDALFETIQAGGIESVLDLLVESPGEFSDIIRQSLALTSPESKHTMQASLRSLLRTSLKHIAD